MRVDARIDANAREVPAKPCATCDDVARDVALHVRGAAGHRTLTRRRTRGHVPNAIGRVPFPPTSKCSPPDDEKGARPLEAGLLCAAPSRFELPLPP
jgi:hypothetical protein